MNALDWLIAADPAIRWQAMRDLTDALPGEVAAERARVATGAGRPSHWNTLRAMRVLEWYERGR